MSVTSVVLKNLKPNPFRNFSADPIDETMVAELRKSIDQNEYWVGAQARRNNGDLEIVFGHHRIAAAMAAGLKQAEVQVFDDISDAEMIRRFADENATQRGNTGTAQVGTVAAAIKYLAKMVLTGVAVEFNSDFDMDKVRRNLANENGMGREIIADFLHGIRGITLNSVHQSLANLKSSGVYAEIIAGVEADIKRENAEALAKLKKAEEEQRKAVAAAEKAEAERKEAAAKAKATREEAAKKRAEYERQKAEEEAKLAEKRRVEADKQMKQFAELKETRDTAEKATAASGAKPITFDHEGVTKYINTPHQLDVFRTIVTGPGVAPYLPVNKQAALAKMLVTQAKKDGKELSGAYLREEIIPLVTHTKRVERSLNEEDRRQLENNAFISKFKTYQEDFARSCRGMAGAATNLGALMDDWPKGLPIPVSNEFTYAVDNAEKAVKLIRRKVL